MIEVGRNNWRSSCPKPCSSRAIYTCLPGTVSSWLLSIFKHGGSTTPLGNLCQSECFLMFRGNFPCFSLCTLPLVLSVAITEKSLALCSLQLRIFRYLYTQMRFPLSLLFSSSPSSLSPSSQEKCSGPLIILVPLCWTLSGRSTSLLYRRTQNWTQNCSRCGLTIAVEWGMIIFCSPGQH